MQNSADTLSLNEKKRQTSARMHVVTENTEKIQ